MFGPGHERGPLLRFIPRGEIALYFAAADVVALPYVDTSDSGVIEMAAAFGTPVVATSAGGLAEALLGSVGQYCVHHAPCPVVIMRGKY